MTGGARSAPLTEAIAVDPDYPNRPGYDAEFLGMEARRVPLPTMPEELVPLAARNSLAVDEPAYVLPYHHFSAVLNRERRLAFFTAVNIDGTTSVRLKRERDRWFPDPRVPADEQTDDAVYRDNPLDRGHLVRRLDPAWGTSRAEAKNRTTWAGLEDYILENADNRDFKASVFTGPVLAADDEWFQGVQLPRQFWKVAVMVKEGGELSATAYLLSQDELIRGLELAPEAFSYGAYKTYQVAVRRVEELTGLSFGALADADPLGRQEAADVAKTIERPEEIVL
jgi:endonuclease G